MEEGVEFAILESGGNLRQEGKVVVVTADPNNELGEEHNKSLLLLDCILLSLVVYRYHFSYGQQQKAFVKKKKNFYERVLLSNRPLQVSPFIVHAFLILRFLLFGWVTWVGEVHEHHR